ncbi:irregular chiasm C-roughest protein [Sarcoptes scabiei]|nr:irregular chiasm C-roughest protein [Sarcoptes scabiei]
MMINNNQKMSTQSSTSNNGSMANIANSSSNHSSNTNLSNSQTGEITIQMQAGLAKDTVLLNLAELTLRTLKDYACNFIDKKNSI